MAEETGGIHPPPPPSTPERAPWEDIQKLIAGLDRVAGGLEELTSLLTGRPPITPVAPPRIDGRLDALIEKLDEFLRRVPIAPGVPVELDGRIDKLVDLANMPLEWGKATGGTLSRLVCTEKDWATDIWAGYELAIVRKTGAGQIRQIKTNDKTSLTPQVDFTIKPDSTSIFIIRKPTVLANKPAWTHGQKDVTTAGTAEQLPDVAVPDGFELVVQAKPDNTGNIFIGNSKANAESTTARFEYLDAGDAVTLKVTNANLVWIDASVTATPPAVEGICYFVEQNE